MRPVRAYFGTSFGSALSKIGGMSHDLGPLPINDDAAALLKAVGVPPSHHGARPALAVIKQCLKASIAKWPEST